MAKYTSAYLSFVDSLGEVEVLRVAAAKKERSDPVTYRREISAMCRGGVVLLCSHVEAYVKELGEVALEKFVSKGVLRGKFPNRMFYHISKDLIDELVDARDPEKIGEKVFSLIISDAEYWNRSGVFPKSIPAERFNKGFANPANDKVRAYLLRFGYDRYRHDININLKSEAASVLNMIDHGGYAEQYCPW